MAWIEMRKQSGLVVDRTRGLRQIRQGRAMSEPSELIGGASVAQLRLVAEREQRLLATRGMTRPRDGQRFVSGIKTLREYETMEPCAPSRRRAATRSSEARS